MLALALGALIAALALGNWLFPYLSSNNDEAVYRLQAAIFRRGHLTVPAAPFAGPFAPWMSAAYEGRLVLVFQPVFPGLLALFDLAFGSTRLALGAIAAAAVLGVYALAGELGFSPRSRLVASALFALSPLALVQSALYLEYLFATALELFALALVVRGARLGRSRLLAAAGVLFGILLFTRPLEALLLGAATMVYFTAVTPRAWAAVARRAVMVSLGAVPLAVAMLAYNAAMTGHALRFPLWAIGGDNAFGFGRRRIVAGSPLIDVTVLNALKATHQNLRSLPHWMFGSILVVPLAFWGLWLRRREPWAWLLASIGILFPLGYFFYWGNLLIVNGRKQIGPHYYLAVMIPTVLFATVGLERLYRNVAARPGWTARKALLSIGAVLSLATAVELPDKVDRNLHFTDSYRAEQRALDAAVAGPAIVVVPVTPDGPYLLHPRGWLVNDLDLRNERLFAADRGAANAELADRFPGRALFRLQAVEASRSPLAFRPSVRPLTITEGPQTRRIAVNPREGFARARAYLQTGPHDRVYCDLAAPAQLELALARDRAELRGCATPLRVAPATEQATVIAGVELWRGGHPQPAELLEVRIPIDMSGGRFRTVDAETWRIVPGEKVPARVLENDPSFQLAAL